jgi:hypothetical protein
MSKINQRGFAFPHDIDSEGSDKWSRGMTYRQWLIGLAMQGLLASDSFILKDGTLSHYASWSCKLADAMIREQDTLFLISGLLWGCMTTPVTLKHPKTGDTVRCGPYSAVGLRDHANVHREIKCVEDWQRRGYQRTQ